MTLPPADKLAHFAVGVLIYAVAHFASPGVGMGCVVAAAGAKEVWDFYHREDHTPDVKDFIATLSGGFLGFISGV